MAGHSKWANIQHRKSAQDAKRGKLFTRLIREITTAARISGSDINSNPRLRLAVDKGLAANMTRDTVERAIKRGAGELEGVVYEEARYEGYGPGGAAVIVECLTDNRNRTVAEVRHTFSKHGGNLGTDGSVAFLFSRQGVLSFSPGADEDLIMEVALEAGAEDVAFHEDGSLEVLTAPPDFEAVCAAMDAAALRPEQAELSLRPLSPMALEEESAEKILRLLDALEELDDVQNVFTNAELPQATIEE
jgi:YebC/PmpR family DNA-binding regulatory protein